MGAHLAKLGRGLSHGPWLWVLSGGNSRRSLQHLTFRLLVHASAEHLTEQLQMRLRYG